MDATASSRTSVERLMRRNCAGSRALGDGGERRAQPAALGAREDVDIVPFGLDPVDAIDGQKERAAFVDDEQPLEDTAWTAAGGAAVASRRQPLARAIQDLSEAIGRERLEQIVDRAVLERT